MRSPLEGDWRSMEAPAAAPVYLDPSPTSARLHHAPSYLETSAISDDDARACHAGEAGVSPHRGERKWRSWLEKAKGHGGMGSGGGPEGWMLRSSSDSSGSEEEAAESGSGARGIFLRNLRDMNDYSLDELPGAPPPADFSTSPSSAFAGVSLDAYGQGGPPPGWHAAPPRARSSMGGRGGRQSHGGEAHCVERQEDACGVASDQAASSAGGVAPAVYEFRAK